MTIIEKRKFIGASILCAIMLIIQIIIVIKKQKRTPAFLITLLCLVMFSLGIVL